MVCGKTLSYFKVILGAFKEAGVIQEAKHLNSHLKCFNICEAKYCDLSCKTDYLGQKTRRTRDLHFVIIIKSIFLSVVYGVMLLC